MAQIANSALLANKAIDTEDVDFMKMKSVFNQYTYSLDFSDIQNWYNEMVKQNCNTSVD